MRVTYTPTKEEKKFTPITLNITIESEEELADLYIRSNIILDDKLIQEHQPDGFDGEADDDTTSDALFYVLDKVWHTWQNN